MADPFELFYLPFRPALDPNGLVVPGAQLAFFISGTNTPQTIYADAALTVELENPVRANAAGKWPPIYIDPALTYRVRLSDQFGAVLDEVDPYVPGSVGGLTGATGPADNTYTADTGGLASFKASPISRKTASLVGIPGVPDGRFNWTLGNYTGKADDKNIIQANGTPLTTGAWVRQGAAGLFYQLLAAGAIGETIQSAIDRNELTPEHFGGVGFTSSDAAKVGADSTDAVQKMADAGALLGLRVTGNGRWYKVGTVSWPSRTRCGPIRLFVRDSNRDVQPVLVDGRTSPKSDLVFTDLEIHGNRLGQTELGYNDAGVPNSSSGTDGQRHGVTLQGRVSDITLERPKIWYCAGDGIWIYHDGKEQVLPSGVDDLFARNITILEPNLQWNGRHGGASESLDGLTIVGGIMTRNGYDMPGYPKMPYSDGGNGRTTNFYNGPKYGRGWDCESYLIGTRYKNHVFEGIDARGNWGGSFLFYHRKHPSVAADYCENLIVRDCQVDDNHGASGDGCMTTFALNDTTGTQYAGSDAFKKVRFINNRCDDNYINVSNANDIEARGGWVNITTTVGYSVIFSASTDVRFCDVPSNKPVFGRPLAITRSGTATTSGWTISGETLEFRRDLPNGAARYRYTAAVTPTATGQAKFTATFTAGFKLTPSKPSSINSSTGNLVMSDAFPSGDGANAIDYYLVANGLNATSFVMEFDAERIS